MTQLLNIASADALLERFKDKPAWADDNWIDPRVDYPQPQYSLFQGETGFMPLGDFQLVKAKKKSGKTYLCSIYAASVLGCTSFGFRSATADPKVIVFDTEQSKENAARVERRIRTLAGLDLHTITGKLNAFDLREIDAKNRLGYIQSKMDIIKPTHVFIDGIVDLGFDYMQSDQSTQLLTKLLAMTKGKDYTCSIIGVLHTNKSDDDHNGRGFLGTESGNKCSEETEVSKRKGTDSVFDVEMTDCRNRPIQPWSFSIDAHGMPFSTANFKENKDLAKLNELSELMKNCFQQSGKDKLKAKELNDFVVANIHLSERTAYSRMDQAERASIIKCVSVIGREKFYKMTD